MGASFVDSSNQLRRNIFKYVKLVPL